MADNTNPLVDKEYQLERFPGKGGWTFVDLPDITKDKDTAFGIVKVRGTIDGFEISDYSLMPRGNGSLFLPVRAEIRKKIGKEEGDHVRVTLFKDDGVFQIPEDFKLLLQQEQGVWERFTAHKRWEQRMCIKWVYSAKRQETVKERIIKTIYKLQRRESIV